MCGKKGRREGGVYGGVVGRHIKDNKAYLRLLSSGTPLSTAHLGISAAYYNLTKMRRKENIEAIKFDQEMV